MQGPNQNLMLVTKTVETSPSGGRELLCKVNHDTLKAIYDEQFALFELHEAPVRSLKGILQAFKGYIDGLSVEAVDLVVQEIQAKHIKKIFIDGSNFGELARVVKERLQNVKIYTFFHNVEARFFLGALRQSKSLQALAVLGVNYLAERKAVRFSDRIICLSERDSRLLRKIYGRGATDISALALQDQLSGTPLQDRPVAEKYILFVGGNFYANRLGISWFVENVAPRIDVKTYIVGRGFESYKDELERHGAVRVVGGVDSLAEWYANAQVVIAPIFDGSGMKTKVAEALMHGKKVIGTPEAFSGYDDVVDQAGWMCTSTDDFVNAVQQSMGETVKPFDPSLRRLYESKYSHQALRCRLEAIMGSDH